ncbi:putative GTP-binding protein [Panicum miliaceum]|uniref:GTP-binding protein n=1 Tax=Panicum miliaceum TaxID=4540 RepID=A0A3L6TRR7_PANMI|nr:putative GTP-binding protein [Panicum miliaceum]
MMFWRDGGGNGRDSLSGGPPCGQVRVLVVGDSGVGKSSLVHLLLNGSAVARPAQTIGCAVGVKHITYSSPGSSSNSIKADAERNFFVELWDVSGHERYKECRSLFYSQINVETGAWQQMSFKPYIIVDSEMEEVRSCPPCQTVESPQPRLVALDHPDNKEFFDNDQPKTPMAAIIVQAPNNLTENSYPSVIFVYDLSQRKTKTNLNKWAVEVAESGTFSAPLGSGGPGGLPVPYLVIANKVDIAPRDGRRVSSGNLVDVARQWVEKQGLLPPSEELPLADSFPGNSGLLTAAKEARYDKEALIKFFHMLIRRRYFSNELPAPNPWSLTPREDTILPVETVNDDDLFQRKSYGSQNYKYNGVAPLPAQRNLTPPPTLYPQQPMSSSSENYRYHRFSSSSIPDSGGGRTSRADINI